MESTGNLASTRTEITNQALRVLLRRLGDAVVVNVELEKDGVQSVDTNGWLVTVYGRGNETPLGTLRYSERGELLSDLDVAIRQMREKASKLVPLRYFPVTQNNIPALWEMLTYAATMPGDVAANIAAAQSDPFLKKYVDGWGRPGDLGVLVLDESGAAVGAAWVRLLEHSYYARNYAADGIPELAIGVRPTLRGQGIGSALMGTLIDAARRDLPAIVLSVRRSNPALHLYERLGFVTVEEIANRVGTASVVMEMNLTADGRRMTADG